MMELENADVNIQHYGKCVQNECYKFACIDRILQTVAFLSFQIYVLCYRIQVINLFLVNKDLG